MGYQKPSYTFEDRNGTHKKIEEYLLRKGFEKLGDGYSKRIYGSKLATVVVAYNLATFMTTIHVGTQNPKFLNDLVTSFPQMKSK